MKKLVRTLTAPMAVAAIAAALTLLSAGSAKAQYNFVGTVSSDPTNAANYTGGGPTYVAGTETSSTALYLESGSGGNPFIYTAATGTSTFGILDQGTGATSNDQVTGGSLTFGTTGGYGVSVLGFTSASSLAVSGGTVNFLGTAGFNGDGNSLELAFQANAALNVSGGLVTTAGDLGLGWYKDTGTVNISGGTLDILGTGGTDLNALGGGATGALNFLAGNGVYEETASSTFASGIAVNFATVTGDKFEVASGNDATFQALATAGSLSYGALTLDDTATDANYYLNYLSETQSGGVETLSVAPEPSTWALMLGGLGVLVLIQRRRSLNA